MEGTIARLVSEKGFGFVKGSDGRDYFFHRTDFNGFFDDLVEDVARRPIKVTFETVPSNKGLRAGNVTRQDDGY